MAKKGKKKVKWFWEKEPEEIEQQMHRAFHEVWDPFSVSFRAGLPKLARLVEDVPVNISETDKELIIRAALPGFKKDEIKVTVTKDTFELSAEKKHEAIERSETFYRREAERKAVHRSFALPVPVDADHVGAKLEEGVLTVTMPKLEVEKKKKKAVEIE